MARKRQPSERLLSPRAHRAIVALLTLPTIQDAAAHVGLSERQLRRWLKIPEFKALLTEAKEQSFNHGLAKLMSATSKAVDRLEKSLDSENEVTKIRAASVIVNNAMKFFDLAQLESRLSALEAKR